MANKAVVVFHGDGAGFWPAFLGRDGFRHCFVVVPSGDYWVLLDGRAGSPRLDVIGSTKDSAAAYYRREGFTIVEVSTRQRPPLWWPWMFHNCVGATKAVLGVRAPWVWTPWQLYRHLRRRNQKTGIRDQEDHNSDT